MGLRDDGMARGSPALLDLPPVTSCSGAGRDAAGMPARLYTPRIHLRSGNQGSGRLTAQDQSHRYWWGPAVDQILADEQLFPLATEERTSASFSLPPGEGQGESPAHGGGYDLSRPGRVFRPLADHLGTVRDLAQYDAASGTTTVVNHRVYDSFGNLVSAIDPATNQPAAVDFLFGFTGRPFDAHTGLQNNVNRWYDPAVGRWLSPDPLGLAAGDANPYGYVGNSPLELTDPSGCLSRKAQRLLDRFNFFKRLGWSDGQIVAAIIQDALVFTGGNAWEAFALVLEICNGANGAYDNDLWASVDHFFQSWTVRDNMPTSKYLCGVGGGLLGSVGAGIANDGYSLLKLPGVHVAQDNPNVPPSRLSAFQYQWGNKGAWAAFWYSTSLGIGSPQWRDFLQWLDRWANRSCY